MTNPESNCPWADNDPLYAKYHDTEWGVPKTTDQELFEKLVLEGFQAGLSWITILRKREKFRTAFDQFDARIISKYGPPKIKALMNDAGIVRNKLKIEATIQNAQAYLELRSQVGFAAFLWNYVDGHPRINRFKTMEDIPAQTELSKKLSKDLKRLGFKFCGPTIVYAFMQSVGMINDHLVTCHRHQACIDLTENFCAPKLNALQ